MNVPVGPTTKVGWGAAFSAFIGAVVVYVTGDHTAQSVTAVELASGGLVIFGITHGFRYLQSLIGLKVPALDPPADPSVADPVTLGGVETDPTALGTGD